MEPSNFDPSSAVPLEQLRRTGLEAYAPLHRAVSDPDVLGRWLSAEVPAEDVERVREAAQGLPPPVDALPLWVIAALARHAVDGALEWFFTLGADGTIASEEQRQVSQPLRAWFEQHRDQLEHLLLIPPRDVPQPWRYWRPGDEPGRLDPRLLDRRVRDVTDTAGGDWWAAAAFVLVRDWHTDLVPLLRALSLDPGEVVLEARDWLGGGAASGKRREPGPRELLSEFRTRSGKAAEHYQARLESATSLLAPDSPWAALLVFADAFVGGPPGLARALADEERVLEALREASQAPAGGPGYRPSATVTRDYWTTEDTLGYGIYADAIGEVIRHPDTRPPLTIGIKAPWGAGKTSLMRMVRERLDPGANGGTPARLYRRRGSSPGAVTNRTALDEAAPERGGAEPERTFAPPLPPPGPRDDGRRATVWFNPWAYQSGEHLWAGLAQAIIDGVTGPMDARERERFWFELNLARVDRARVRQHLHRLLLERVLPLALPAVLLLLAGAAVLVFAPGLSALVPGGISLAGATAAGLGAADRARRFLRAELKGSFDELVRQPDYEHDAGTLHLVQADIRDVLDLVATERRPLVVFVDDLDRCSADVVSEVIEALNLFLAGEYPNCIFVLAIEPDVVAAHLEAGRADLLKVLGEHLPAGTHYGMGWRFLDKMVQLPLRLPAPEPAQLDGFIDGVLGARRAAHHLDVDAVRRRIERLRAELPSIEKLRDAAAAVEREERGEGGEAGGGRAPLAAETIRAAEEAVADRLRDDAPEVRAVIGSYADLLTRNPREVKRFINLFRFYAFVQVRRELRDLPAPTLAQVGKMAILAIRWPYLLSVLGLAVPADRTATVLGALEEAAGGEDTWTKAVDGAGLKERMRELIVADADLRHVLGDDPPLAEVLGFL